MANTLQAGDLVQYWIEGTIYNALVVGATHEPYLNLIYIDPERGVIRVGAVELTEGKTTGFVLRTHLYLFSPDGKEIDRMNPPSIPITGTVGEDDWKSAVAHSGPMGGEVVSIEAGAVNMQRTDQSNLDAIADEQKAAIATDATQASINGYIESQVDGDDFPEPHMEAPAAP
jgi:hypothetical protein